ncbi:hypothetical protein BV898_18498 [Hypsibius exemplaris]|uniref:DNA fragmentation factor 40 C-terminal domain-containing protein n=1 Tax=Hypsibius exemplaris TaxID=2072580 RepID=A0A9X6RN34_HYPEX|nr:hypothetical protein BV898_18498 [Hypsibius exemplaris]
MLYEIGFLWPLQLWMLTQKMPAAEPQHQLTFLFRIWELHCQLPWTRSFVPLLAVKCKPDDSNEVKNGGQTNGHATPVEDNYESGTFTSGSLRVKAPSHPDAFLFTSESVSRGHPAASDPCFHPTPSVKMPAGDSNEMKNGGQTNGHAAAEEDNYESGTFTLGSLRVKLPSRPDAFLFTSESFGAGHSGVQDINKDWRKSSGKQHAWSAASTTYDSVPPVGTGIGERANWRKETKAEHPQYFVQFESDSDKQKVAAETKDRIMELDGRSRGYCYGVSLRKKVKEVIKLESYKRIFRSIFADCVRVDSAAFGRFFCRKEPLHRRVVDSTGKGICSGPSKNATTHPYEVVCPISPKHNVQPYESQETYREFTNLEIDHIFTQELIQKNICEICVVYESIHDDSSHTGREDILKCLQALHSLLWNPLNMRLTFRSCHEQSVQCRHWQLEKFWGIPIRRVLDDISGFLLWATNITYLGKVDPRIPGAHPSRFASSAINIRVAVVATALASASTGRRSSV